MWKLLFTSYRQVRDWSAHVWLMAEIWVCVPAGITTASRRRPHLRSGRSCARSRIYGNTAAGRPLHQYTWDCPAGWFLCRVRKKLLREPLSHSRSPTGDTPPGHQGGPMHRRIPFPTRTQNRARPGPHTGAGHPPAWPFLLKKTYRRKFSSVQLWGALILFYGCFIFGFFGFFFYLRRAVWRRCWWVSSLLLWSHVQPSGGFQKLKTERKEKKKQRRRTWWRLCVVGTLRKCQVTRGIACFSVINIP